MPSPTRSEEIPALDGIRSLALCLVVFLHIGLFTGVPGPPIVKLVSDFSIWGLYLFFVLSGFLLFLPYARSILTGSPWPSARRFYVRRARRILPVYYVALDFIVVNLAWLVGAVGMLKWIPTLIFTGLLLHDMRLDSFNLIMQLDSPLWSLAVEWQFYLVLPWVALGLARLAGSHKERWRRLGIGLFLVSLYGFGGRALAAIAHYRWGFAMPVSIPGPLGAVLAGVWGMEGKYMEVFALGMTVSLIYVWGQNRQCMKIGLGALTCFLVGLTTCFAWAVIVRRLPSPPTESTQIFPLGSGWTWMIAGPWSLGLCCAALLLATLTGPSILRQVFSWRPLRFIGQISYSLYIWHMPIILRLSVVTHTYILMAVSTWIILLVIGSLSYYFIERPFLVGRAQRTVLTHRTQPTILQWLARFT